MCKRFFFLHFHEKICVKYLANAYFPFFFSHRSISCTTFFVSLNYGVGVNLRNRITEVTPFIAFLLLQIPWKTRKNILPKIDYRFFLYLFVPFSGCQTPIHFTKPMNVFKIFPAKKCNFFFNLFYSFSLSHRKHQFPFTRNAYGCESERD